MSRIADRHDLVIEMITAIVAITIVSFFMIISSPNFGVFWIIFGLLFGLICAGMAGNRGRSSAGGLAGGFFFGFFAIVYYLIVGDALELRVKKEEDVRRKYRSELEKNDDTDQ